MTSEERRAVRYQRRQQKRREKRARLSEHDSFASVFSYANLYRSYRYCRKGVAWKASVQKFIITAPLGVYDIYDKLRRGTYKSPGFFEFDLFERGKARHIRSTTIGERVVQRTLCDQALNPILCRTFIHDNGASLPKKGYDFAVNRLTQHLRRHIREHGREGYILLFDFKRFFDNVDHALIKAELRRQFTDPRIVKITSHFVDMFGNRGLGLGSQISQVLALVSGNRLDHYIKEVLGIKGYARYMDDGYLIHHSKAYLQECLVKIRALCDKLGIVLSEKKTQIVKLSHGFPWLKMRVFVTPSGKIVKKIYKRSVTRERRKLKKLRKMLDRGKVTREDIYNAWQSWKSYALRFNAWHTVQNMGKLYDRLFVFEEGDDYGNIHQSA
ncbi:MAG: hypothetical protein IKQ54_05365 [Oscillospiraceae bacterium]|nr:hypothetical protein [Oscillospiraceae bacterium]